MTISDRIFEKLRQMNMSQKVFSEETGISQSTISEWKSKRTNPTSEKIMVICKVLDVTPEWLLSGIENTGERGNNTPWYVIDKDTEMGTIIKGYHEMNEQQRGRLLGYVEAMLSMKGRKNLRGYINRLLEMGRISRTIPDKPNSSNQKYITVSIDP